MTEDVLKSMKSVGFGLAAAMLIAICQPFASAGLLYPTAETGVTGMVTTITRSDGTIQVTYNGLPLYYYSGDKNPGDSNGQGGGSVWFVARP